jgi:hypothetical protein
VASERPQRLATLGLETYQEHSICPDGALAIVSDPRYPRGGEVIKSQVDSGDPSRRGAREFRDIVARHGVEFVAS